jgi:lysine-specific demethylase 3
VKELTVDKPNANQQELAALQARREKHTHCNPFFLSCTKRNEHMAKDFSPVSRFFLEELDEAIPEMERLLAEYTAHPSSLHPNGYASAIPELSSSSSSGSTSASSSAGVPTPPPDTNALATALLPRKDDLSMILHNNGSTVSPAYVPLNLPHITASVPYHEIKRYAYAEINSGDSISAFAPIWHRGDPIVVAGCVEHFKIAWTPEYFVKNYGEQTCLIIECQTDANKRITVGQYFDMFGKYNERTECWKLKDWPPSTDFKTAFPELYKDFSDAVPVPDYVRRDGVGNIGSHFPTNTIAPDLGPKMYNAFASSLGDGSKGSTKLHMDMADAVNIMTYAEACPDGSPGCAAWDLFRACDSDKLRTFLRNKFPKQSAATDPIHAQQCYLDEVLRKELYEQQGVMSYRVYQRPGEAVFIPAGCAHQVANLADCVKVAIDFVSVENIMRCEGLTREFRDLNQRLAWKEDVLQLRNMMWFAWLNCGILERGGSGDGMADMEDDGGVSGKKRGKGKKKGASSSVGGTGPGPGPGPTTLSGVYSVQGGEFQH